MLLNDLPSGVYVYGDVSFRGKCPKEDQEQVTFFNRLRREYPDTWGKLALHPRNEGLKIGGHITAVSRHKAEGMTPGALTALLAHVKKVKDVDADLAAVVA